MGEGNEEEEEVVTKKVKGKHESGQYDLQRVTDFAEEKEVALQSNVQDLIVPQNKPKAEKIVIRKDDIELLMKELEVSKQVADKKLREHRGNVKDAIRSILAI